MMTHDWQWEPIDQKLAELFANVLNESASPALTTTVKLLSHQIRQGDICLQLSDYAGRVIENSRLPGLPEWLAILNDSNTVGEPGAAKPLILDDGRLYFHRYHVYEQQLVDALKVRASRPQDECVDEKAVEFDNPVLSEEQKQAVLSAAHSTLSIITGGPGTGKTTTIAGLIKYLLLRNPDARIALAAPTGKAAARIQQAITDFDNQLSSQVQVSTVHRLLGFKSGSVTFRHNAGNPLSHDAVIVDEASMIDLALMSKLVESVRCDARLVLLGDADQLASVEAGAVFGELCRNVQNNQLHHCISRLQFSYRFETYPGIGRLANAVNEGDSKSALQLLVSEQYPEISWHQPEIKHLDDFLAQYVAKQFNDQADSTQRVQAMNHFQLICAHRKGQSGVERLNQYIETWSRKHHYISGSDQLYDGKPVIISSNNYQLDLFNGDIGILIKSQFGDIKAVFPAAQGKGVRKISPARLRSFETAWALTVHQSQGSEFNHVLMVLPEQISPVLNRELIYTAITRAKESFHVMGNKDVLEQVISMQTSRQSGIARRLSSNG